jgi:hypothetical protein
MTVAVDRVRRQSRLLRSLRHRTPRRGAVVTPAFIAPHERLVFSARALGVGVQCGMTSTSIGKYWGAPLSGGGPPMTSASAGPSFSSMKRSKASRDSQMS